MSDHRRIRIFISPAHEAALAASTREVCHHEAFAEFRRRTYIGRPAYFETLDRHGAGDGGPLVLRGDSGAGKTALLANWIDHWRVTHPQDFIFQHYIDGTPDGADHRKLMSRLIAEIKLWSGDAGDAPHSADGLLRDFPLWLAKARLKAERDGVRCILVLDALNQLEDNERARLLGWLPSHSFNGPLRLIVSTLQGDTVEALEKRGWDSLGIEPLALDERRRMIAEYLKRFGKTLDLPRANRLAAAAAAANPLYLKIVLDELRVAEDDLLEQRLDACLAAQDIPRLVKQVLVRYQCDYERECPGLVREALGLIWAARRGLSETELLRLLKPADTTQWQLSAWLPLRAALEGWLVDRGGILNFAHDSLRAAVETTFAPDEDRQDELRLRLADDFERQPISSRSCEELPWLLFRTQSYQCLRQCLLDADRFLEIKKRDEEELRRYWVDVDGEQTMGSLYTASFEQWSSRLDADDSRVSFAASELYYFLKRSGLFKDAELLIRRTLECETTNLGPNHPTIAIRLGNLANLLESRNRLEEVEGLYRRALSITEQSAGPEHPQAAVCLSNLARFLLKANRLEEAERLARRALAIDEKCLGPGHPAVAAHLDLLAELLQRANRLAEAEPCIRRSLTILEAVFGLGHPNVLGSLNHLAVLLHRTNRLSEAEPFVRRVLAIDEKCYGPEHITVARDLNNLGGVLEYTDRLDQAEALYRNAQCIFEKNLGAGHPDVGTSLNNLAQALKKMNRLAEAQPILLRAVHIFLTLARATHQLDPRLQTTINNYGGLLESMGRSVAQINTALREIAPEFYRRMSHEA